MSVKKPFSAVEYVRRTCGCADCLAYARELDDKRAGKHYMTPKPKAPKTDGKATRE